MTPYEVGVKLAAEMNYSWGESDLPVDFESGRYLLDPTHPHNNLQYKHTNLGSINKSVADQSNALAHTQNMLNMYKQPENPSLLHRFFAKLAPSEHVPYELESLQKYIHGSTGQAVKAQIQGSRLNAVRQMLGKLPLK